MAEIMRWQHTGAVEINGSLDFLKLILDKGIRLIAVCVIVCEGMKSLILTAFRY